LEIEDEIKTGANGSPKIMKKIKIKYV